MQQVFLILHGQVEIRLILITVMTSLFCHMLMLIGNSIKTCITGINCTKATYGLLVMQHQEWKIYMGRIFMIRLLRSR